jgi:hypothetical protein
MHHTIQPQTETPQTELPKRFQCRHIFTDGHRCGSPCLRGEELCFYHHTTRKPAAHTRRSRSSAFELPLPEDQSAIQHSIGQVLQRIAANDIDPRRAGLLLYGLQIASLNLPKPQATQPELVEETTIHPELGTLAPPAEVGKNTQRKSAVALLIEKLIEDGKQREDDRQKQQDQPQPATLPALQAAYDPFMANGPMLNPLPHPFDRTLSVAERGAGEILQAAEDHASPSNPCNSGTPVVALSPACRAATHLRSLPSAIGATQRPAESSHASLKPPRHFRVFELPEPQPKKVAALSFSRTISKERP